MQFRCIEQRGNRHISECSALGNLNFNVLRGNLR